MLSLKQILLTALVMTCFGATPVSAADIKAGEQKAASCAGCHGSKGQSSNPQWPNLAGQQSTYLVNQLNAFKAGTRNNPIMQGIAANLGAEDITNIAAYFSSLQAVSAGGYPALVKSGQSEAAVCLGCHGAAAQGNGQFPRLAGQHPEYLIKQLKSFKEGARKNGPMQAIAANLTEESIDELAAYLGSLK